MPKNHDGGAARMETLVPILVAAGLVLVMGIEWSFRPRTRARRALRRTKNMSIAEIKDGAPARITGIVSALGETMTAPIGEKPCIGFRLEIQVLARGSPIVMRREECGGFAITDESGEATVDGPVLFGLDWENGWSVVQQRWYGVLKAAGVTTQGLIFRRRFAYRQALLEPGDLVSACGVAFFEPDPTASAVDTRSPSLRPHLRGTGKDRVAVADAYG
jgi:hypothetical protein